VGVDMKIVLLGAPGAGKELMHSTLETNTVYHTLAQEIYLELK